MATAPTPTYNYTVAPNGSYLFASGSEGIRYFVDNYGMMLTKSLAGSGIFFATAVAQKCQESAYGTSHAATAYNNFGGIMINGKLKQFSSPSECFDFYVSTLLSPTHRYIQSGLLVATTPYIQMKAIAVGGYCTAPPAATYYSRIEPTITTVLKMYSIGKIG